MGSIKMVPVTCSQCGAQLEVDASKERTECPYCGTSFLVESAVLGNDTSSSGGKESTVKTLLGFVGEQLSESRKYNKEIKKQQMIEDRKIMMSFIKMIPAVLILMLVLAFLIQRFGLFDDGDQAVNSDQAQMEEADGAVIYDSLRDGQLWVDVVDPELLIWQVEDMPTTLKVEEDSEDESGYHFCFSADQEEGSGYAVLGQYDNEMMEAVYYTVMEAEIQDWEIVSYNLEIVENLDDYAF